MPDFGAPVADQIQAPNPNQGMQTLSGLLTLRNQQQNYQIGQQQLQVGAGQAQQAQQQMQERQALQQMLASGKAPDGTPIKDASGEIDPVAFGKAANTYLPLTGQGVQQSIIQTLDNRVKLNDSVRGLGQGFRNDISGIVRSAIGTDKNPSDIGAALDSYAQQNPQAAPAIARAKAVIGSAPPNMSQQQRDMGLQKLAMEFQPATTTEAFQRPGLITSTGLGGGVQVSNINPNAAIPVGPVGTEIPQGVAPAQQQTVGKDAFGNPAIIVKAPSGAIVSGPGIANPLGPKPLAPGDAQAIPQLAQERSNVNNAAQQVPAQRYNNAQIMQLAQNATTGPGSAQWTKLLGTIGLADQDSSAANAADRYQLLGHFVALQAQNNAQAMGVHTNAGQEIASVATGSPEMNRQALIEATRTNDALSRGMQDFNQGMETAIKANGGDVRAKRDFQNAWSQNFDPNIYKLKNALEAGDQAEAKKVWGGLTPQQQQQMKTKQQNLVNLINNGHL